MKQIGNLAIVCAQRPDVCLLYTSLRGLCELAHIEDCVEQWQHRAEQDIGLTEYLGLTGEEHKTFLCGGRDALAALLEPQRRKQMFVLYQLQRDEENAIQMCIRDRCEGSSIVHFLRRGFPPRIFRLPLCDI